MVKKRRQKNSKGRSFNVNNVLIFLFHYCIRRNNHPCYHPNIFSKSKLTSFNKCQKSLSGKLRHELYSITMYLVTCNTMRTISYIHSTFSCHTCIFIDISTNCVWIQVSLLTYLCRISHLVQCMSYIITYVMYRTLWTWALIKMNAGFSGFFNRQVAYYIKYSIWYNN